MWELFTHPSNIFFSVSLCLMLLLGMVELLMLIVGLSSQGFLDQFIPDQLFEAQHPDLNLNTEQGFFIQLLDWLYIGRIPVLVWLVIFLTTYALSGLIFQSIYHELTQSYVPAWLIAPAIFILCMPIVRLISAVLAKILPKDETTAIYGDELIGLHAEIILGEARPEYPAQAKVKDQHGLTHYILVEPESDLIFTPGQQVVLTQKTSRGFTAIPQLN